MNPYEHAVRDYGLFVQDRLPVVLGNDIAGVVENLGPSAPSTLRVGDHVFGQTNYLKESDDQCGLQEYCLLDAYTVAKIPVGLSDDDGASLVTSVVSPFWAIFGADGLDLPFPFPAEDAPAEHPIDYSKESIVVIGAGANCGKYAVQVCALAGFGTIVATADRAKNEAQLRRYGATHVVDRHASDVEAQIRAIVGDDLIYALDIVNSDYTLGVSVLSNTRRGVLSTLVPGKVEDVEKIGEKKVGYEARWIQGQSHNQPELGRKFWKFLPVWMTEGRIQAVPWDVLQGLDPEKVNRVLDVYRDGGRPVRQVHVHL